MVLSFVAEKRLHFWKGLRFVSSGGADADSVVFVVADIEGP